MKAGKIIKTSKRLVTMKDGKIIKIFQKVDYFEGWKDYQNLPKGWLLYRLGRLSKSSKRLVIMKAGKIIKIFQKVGYWEADN